MPKYQPYHRQFNLDIHEQACFHCPLSEEDPPRDCTWTTSGSNWSPYCPFQREYAEKYGKENKEEQYGNSSTGETY